MANEKTYPASVDGGGNDVGGLGVADVQGLAWDTELGNNRRALRALAAVATYGDESDMARESLRTVLGDLLVDVRHLGDAAGFDVDEMLLNSLSCYGAELYNQ